LAPHIHSILGALGSSLPNRVLYQAEPLASPDNLGCIEKRPTSSEAAASSGERMVFILCETCSNLAKRVKEMTHFSVPNEYPMLLEGALSAAVVFPATETMKGCGRCAKPRSGSVRFCKRLWARSVRPQVRHRHTPHVGGPEHLRQVAAASPELDRSWRS
jgi:hypothetical protein